MEFFIRSIFLGKLEYSGSQVVLETSVQTSSEPWRNTDTSINPRLFRLGILSRISRFRSSENVPHLGVSRNDDANPICNGGLQIRVQFSVGQHCCVAIFDHWPTTLHPNVLSRLYCRALFVHQFYCKHQHVNNSRFAIDNFYTWQLVDKYAKLFTT